MLRLRPEESPAETVLGVPGGGGGAGRNKGVVFGATSRRGGKETHAGGLAQTRPSGPRLPCATSFGDTAGLENDTVRGPRTQPLK